MLHSFFQMPNSIPVDGLRSTFKPTARDSNAAEELLLSSCEHWSVEHGSSLWLIGSSNALWLCSSRIASGCWSDDWEAKSTGCSSRGVWVPAPVWWLKTVCKSSPGGSSALFWSLRTPGTNVVTMHADKPVIHINKILNEVAVLL